MWIIPDDEIPRMVCPRKILIKKYRKDKSYLARKMRMIQTLHDRENTAAKNKITYQLETSHNHSDGLI